MLNSIPKRFSYNMVMNNISFLLLCQIQNKLQCNPLQGSPISIPQIKGTMWIKEKLIFQ